MRRKGSNGTDRLPKILWEYSPERYYKRLMAVYKKAIELGQGGANSKSEVVFAEKHFFVKHKALQTTRCDILRVKFDLIAYHVVMETIQRWRVNGESHYITITNPHSVMLCHRDVEMWKATEMAGKTLPDGIGIILAAQLLGYSHSGRVTGPLLMLKLCDWGRKYGYRNFFYGGTDGVAKKLAENLCKKYPGLEVAGTCAPPFRPLTEKEDKQFVDMISSTKPDIVWVGLGAPKQEKWMAEHLGRIKATAMIGVGAAFDFHSGNVKWGPDWIRKLGIEWVYRLAQNPRRMWRRNLDSPIFLSKVLYQLFKMRAASHNTGMYPGR